MRWMGSGLELNFQIRSFGECVRYSGRVVSTLTEMVMLAACNALGQAAAPNIPAHKAAIVLFDGSDLKNFDTFLTGTGLNSDPGHVFQVEGGVIHVSGKEFGYLITKESYQNFYLRSSFKWGVRRNRGLDGK